MPAARPRVAVRGLMLIDDRLLMVNAWGGGKSDLLCAPGGGVEPHSSLTDNLKREFYEETGCRVEVHAPCLINEFHARSRDFHQVDIYFHVSLVDGDPLQPWKDPEGIVTERFLLSRRELNARRFKPDCLPEVAWDGKVLYDPLEPLIR